MLDQSTADRRGILVTLFAAVTAARESEQSQRHLAAHAATTTAVAQARASTLHALLAYAGAIDALNWPVPRVILADIRMRQGMYGHRSPP